MLFNIVGLTINLIWDEPTIKDSLRLFLSSNKQIIDLTITIKSCNAIPYPMGYLLLNDKIKWLLKQNSKDEICVFVCDESNEILYMLETDNLWNNCLISYNVNKRYKQNGFFGPLSEIIFRNHILFHQGFILHASALSYQGKGFMFSAPSGIGKSTQADLWVKHKSARILNGDRPAIRFFDNKVRVYGTPWCGTSDQYLNESAPLEAIFMLEQSQTNEIHELPFSEILSKIIARCYLPYFDQELMNIALDNIGAVMYKTPVYLLKCRPDSGAVDVVTSCLGL